MSELVRIQARIQALLPRDGALSDAFTEASTKPPIAVEALDVLGKMSLRAETLREKGLESGAERRAFERAVAELEANVELLEALSNDRQCPPFAYVTWVWRVAEGLTDYSRSTLAPITPKDGAVARSPEPTPALRAPRALLPPLSLGAGLRVNAVGPLLDLAARETAFVRRRRRLLEAARRSLLETQAAVEVPAGEVQERLLYIAEQIRTLNEVENRGVSPTVDVAEQLKRAVGRRDAALVSSCLLALRHFASSGGGREPLRRLANLSPSSLPRSVSGSLTAAPEGAGHPPGVLEAVTRGIEASRALRRGRTGVVEAQLAAQSLGPAAVSQLFRGAASVDGCFELGRSVAPVRAREEQARLRPVPFPTQTMVLRPAESVAELPSSLLGDPRFLLLDLATGRLLTRAYLGSPRVGPPSGERVSEARYYLLDGSDSMAGRRGLLRDSLLLSELSSLVEFLSSSGAVPVVPVVYYRYFAKRAEPTRRVATREEALTAIEDCLGRQRGGGTDIESAILSTLQEIRRERENDETLKRVQLVLVSDGVARVDLEKIWEARRRLGDIPVGVSVVALGSENEALKRLAAAQRKAGQEVFYHFLPDHSIRKLIEPEPAPIATKRSQPEPAPSDADPARPSAELAEAAPIDDEARWEELASLADEWLALEAGSDLEAIEESRTLVESLVEVGLSFERDYSDSQRARHESLVRDERVLKRRFDRWFPALGPGAAPSGGDAPPDATEPMVTIEALLATVIDVTDLLDGSPLQRRYDAIEVFERLLLEAGIPPWRYAGALEDVSPKAGAAIREIRRVASLRDRTEAPR